MYWKMSLLMQMDLERSVPTKPFHESVIGKVQGQAGLGLEQPDPVEDVPADGRGVGPDGP